MSAFPKTRAAAEYAARHSPAELTRARAIILLARLGACEDILPGGDGDVPAALHGLLRDQVLAIRDLASPAWLDASGDDPDVAAFTVLEATASPPDTARIDEICSRVLWARFAPDAERNGPGHDGTGPGQPAPTQPARRRQGQGNGGRRQQCPATVTTDRNPRADTRPDAADIRASRGSGDPQAFRCQAPASRKPPASPRP